MAFISKHNMPTLGQRQKKQNLLDFLKYAIYDKLLVNKFFTTIPVRLPQQHKILEIKISVHLLPFVSQTNIF
jgi:hypothetical protein